MQYVDKTFTNKRHIKRHMYDVDPVLNSGVYLVSILVEYNRAIKGSTYCLVAQCGHVVT